MSQNTTKTKNMKAIYSIIFAAILLTSMVSCTSKEAQIPAYVHIPKMTLQVRNDQEGSVSSKITEAWVYMDNNFLGGYPLPATFPVLATGQHEFRIFAGVHENGILAAPVLYPFYAPNVFSLQLSPQKIDTVSPVFSYTSTTKFAFIENFESASQLLRDDRDLNLNTKIVASTENVFEGMKSGMIVLDTANAFVEVATIDSYSGLQTQGATQVWAELNYWSDVDVRIGLVGLDADGNTFPYYDLNLLGKKTWGKVYVNFTRPLVASQLKSYKFALRAGLPIDTNGNFTQMSGKIFIDNIKFLYF